MFGLHDAPEMIKTIIRMSLLILIVIPLAWAVLLLSHMGGIATEVQLPGGASPEPFELAELQCEHYRIPTRLSQDGWFEYEVMGEFCWTGDIAEKTLQLLIPGAGYGTVYWDFPYQPDTYSYKRAALRQGYATFNYYRTGTGASDHPFGMLVNVEHQVYVLSQLIDFFQAEHAIRSFVTVGHSLGSVIALVHAGEHSSQLDGVILTGFLHNSNPAFNQAMRKGTDLAAFTEDFGGHLFDPVYMVSKANTRKDIFYNLENTDPMVPVVDELNRQTLTVAEIISMLKYFKLSAEDVDVPVLVVTGEDDFVVCGGDLDCSNHQLVVEHESLFFSAAACVKTVMVEKAGHNINLHHNAQQTYQTMFDWLAERSSHGCNQS